MFKTTFYILLIAIIATGACNGIAQQITIVNNNHSDYRIIIPQTATAIEQKSASVLQGYIKKISGLQLPIANDGSKSNAPGIYIGQTFKAGKVHPAKMASESYLLQTEGNDLIICAGNGRGLMYGTYAFLENYLHCKKLSNEPAIVSSSPSVIIPGRIHDEARPPLIYREVYYPASHDAEYLEWNQLQNLDDLWGLWGHSFNKLVPVQTYFAAHPDYFALVKGVRLPSQLCLSNDAVFNIVVSELKKRMAENKDAIYWSVSPNDDNGYCQCDRCRAVDNEQGSPSGSLIKFVNKVAAAFPDKKITTLAYGYTHKAPKNLKPADNVYVFISDIDAYRNKPLTTESTAAPFRNDLKAWGALTGNLFVWDYITQFTNYLAPFPNFNTLQPNMQYLKDNGVKGIFAQGSGDTYGEWAELRSYVMAKLIQNDKADVHSLVVSFVNDYYGKAAKYIQQYFDLLHDKMNASGRKLDIYGNPVNEWKTWLSPENLDEYSTILDKAEAAAEGNAMVAERVMRARLPLEYTVLQQARFYGIEKHGAFVKSGAGKWEVKPKLESKVSRFVANCKKAAVTELSEAGPYRKPDEYQAEWNTIFKEGVTPTKALDAQVSLKYPFAEDYPAKGNHTLTDGNPGYSDFSYNWLCFYGVPMIATIDLGKVQSVSHIKMHFLDDPRHWIFLPSNVSVEVSADGSAYHSFADLPATAAEEHYEISVKPYTVLHAPENVRYIRVTANNLSALPAWRYSDNKKPMIACDEIYVQ